VTITSQVESDFVYGLLQSCNKNWYYIGGTDEGVRGQWQWVTGESWEFTNWAPGEPNNLGGYESYLMLYRINSDAQTASKWNDTNNDNNNAPGFYNAINGGFICEWDN